MEEKASMELTIGGILIKKGVITKANPEWRRAKDIMGPHFFGFEEAMRHLDIAPTHSEADLFSKVPFTDTKLEACCGSHILVANFGLPIVELMNRLGDELFRYEGRWLRHQQFASRQGKPGWELIRKTLLEGSLTKTWAQQQRMVRENESIPIAQSIAYTVIGHFLSTSERLLQQQYVRCSDEELGARHICVGRFERQGVSFDRYLDNGAYEFGLGILTSEHPDRT